MKATDCWSKSRCNKWSCQRTPYYCQLSTRCGVSLGWHGCCGFDRSIFSRSIQMPLLQNILAIWLCKQSLTYSWVPVRWFAEVLRNYLISKSRDWILFSFDQHDLPLLVHSFDVLVVCAINTRYIYRLCKVYLMYIVFCTFFCTPAQFSITFAYQAHIQFETMMLCRVFSKRVNITWV